MTICPYIILLDKQEFDIVKKQLTLALQIKSSNPTIVEGILRKIYLADKFQFLLEELG